MKMMKNVGVIGCGRIFKRHYEAIRQSQHLCLVAVAEHDENKANSLNLANECRVYSSYIEMLESEKFDLVSVLTESGNHFEHAKAVIEAGVNVLIEKPMTLSVAEADKLIDLAERENVELFVVKQNRYNFAISQLRDHFDNGGFGKLTMGTVRLRWCRDQHYYDQAAWRGTKSLDGGVICNQASHHLDMLLWFMGPPKSVFAKKTTALVDIEMEDTLVATVEFQSGALGVIEATTAIRPRNTEASISLMGEKGIAIVGGNALNKIDLWEFAEGGDRTTDDKSEHVEDVYGTGHNAIYADLFSAGAQNRLVSGTEARRTVQLIEALYESASAGVEVMIDV